MQDERARTTRVLSFFSSPSDFKLRPVSVDRPHAARVASFKSYAPSSTENVNGLEINDEAKEIVQMLGSAINEAVERSPEVAEAIERLRAAGYEMELTLRLEIGLREREQDDSDPLTEARLELTDEDRRTLRSMRIRFDDHD